MAVSPSASSKMQAPSPRMGRPPQQPQTRQPIDQQRMAPQQTQTRQEPPDMDQLRTLAYQQRQQQRRNRVITPNMLKARPIEIKQNVVMRSKHKSSAGSVTSEISHKSDITEKATNNKARLRRNHRLQTLETVETFESLKQDAENTMAMANSLLAEATEAKRQAQLEIAREKDRLKAAADARQKAQLEEAEMQRLVQAQAAEERKRFQAIEKKLAAETEQKRRAHAEAEERIRILEAEQIRLDQEHKNALAEAQRQAQIAKDEEKRRLQVEQARLILEEQLRIEAEQKEKILSAKQHEEETKQYEVRRKAQEEAEERIRSLEAEKIRLQQEHNAALAEAQMQAKIAADGERHAKIAEAELRRLLREEENRRKLEDEEKRKSQERAEERIRMLEAEQIRLDEEHRAALAKAQRKAKVAQDEEKRRQEVEQQRLQLDQQLRIEVDRQAKMIAAAQKRRFIVSTAETEQNHKDQAEAARRIAILESEQRRLDQEHKAALAEAQRQSKNAQDEEKRRLEVEQNKQVLEEQLRIEVDRHAQIASSERKKRLEAETERLKLEKEAQRQAQIAADEGKKRLEAESRRLELEKEAQKQAQIAVEEEKKRLEADKMRLQLEARVLAENAKRDADEESRKWFDIKRMHVGRQAAEIARHKSPASKQIKNKAFPDTQSCSGFFVSEGVSDCSSDEEGVSTLKEGVELELFSSQEPTKLGEDIIDEWKNLGEHLTNGKASNLVGKDSFDVGGVAVRHEVRCESPSIYSASVISSSSRREKTTTQTKSFGLKSLWSTKKESEKEVKGSNAGCEGMWKSKTFLELAAEQGNDFLAMDNEALRLLDQACLQAEERAEDTMNEILSVTSQMENERDEPGDMNGVFSSGFDKVVDVTDFLENAKGEVKEDKTKRAQKLFKSLRGVKINKCMRSDTAKEGDEIDSDLSRVKQLELELSELSQQIAQKKKEACDLMTESSNKSISSFNQAIQQRAGKASEEKDRREASSYLDEVIQDTKDEAIEVMPTLSDVEKISVNTPVSVDESAFAHKRSLLQRTGSLIKRNPLSRKGSFTRMSKEERRAFRHAKAMAKVDNQFEEIIEETESGCDHGEELEDAAQNGCGGQNDNTMISNHSLIEENATFVSENGASFIDSDDPMYDEDVAMLVDKTSDDLDYEDDDADSFVLPRSASQAQSNPPDQFIHIPANRVPVHRVRSKEIAIQTDDYSTKSPRVMMSPRVMSPRVMSPRSESFWEKVALFGSTACMGGSRAILTCADTCNEYNPDSRAHEALSPTSSYNTMEVSYYDPTSPPASSMFRRRNAAYSQDEEDLVTRAFVNALHRVESVINVSGEKTAQEEYSEPEYVARSKPRRHSKKHVTYDDIMSVDGRYISAREHTKRQQERVPRNLALKPKMHTQRGSDQVWREERGSPRQEWREERGSPRQELTLEVSSPREKSGLGKKMFKGIKKLAKVRIVYDD
jgi:hypothetical protein